MKYTFKKSKRLAALTDLEKNVSKDEAILEIKEYCENVVKLSAEDLSPMAIEKITNAIKINDRLHEVYHEENLIAPEVEERLKELKEDYNKFEEEVYGFASERYLDYLNKNNYTAYINEFKDDEFYLRDQMDEEEKGLLSEFTNEGINLKNKFGSTIGLKKKNKKPGYGFIRDEDLKALNLLPEEDDDKPIDTSNMSEEEIKGLELATKKAQAMETLKSLVVNKIPKVYDNYIASDYE